MMFIWDSIDQVLSAEPYHIPQSNKPQQTTKRHMVYWRQGIMQVKVHASNFPTVKPHLVRISASVGFGPCILWVWLGHLLYDQQRWYILIISRRGAHHVLCDIATRWKCWNRAKHKRYNNIYRCIKTRGYTVYRSQVYIFLNIIIIVYFRLKLMV